jgi:rare lipoprotein A
MRTMLGLRNLRPARMGAGALILAVPASAVALAATQADAQSAIQFNLEPRQLSYGHDVAVKGTASASNAGQRVELEFVPAGGTSWRAISSATVASDGRFRMVAPVRHSGLLRVAGPGGASASAPVTPLASAATTTTGVAASASQRVSVSARFRVSEQSINVLAGQRVDVRGKLLPAVAGRRIQLRGRSGGSWQTLATAVTGGRGGFDLHYVAGSTGRQTLRVRFRGDRLNTNVWTHVGNVTVFHPSVASWYSDGGSTACGFHAYYGVANRDLPCGTQVTFRYGGRSVTATVDDRGPFVGGRDWDLNQNTAGALGFGGVDTVWTSI